MPIQIRYFAKLRDQLGHAEARTDQPGSAMQIWQRVNPDLPLPANTLIAINQAYASPDSPVVDGDELAFFPPVTGG